MGIDTEIPGSPADIRGAATWLRTSIAPNLDSAAEEFNKARLDAEQVWDSEAGSTFREAVKRGDRATQDVEKAARNLANDLDALAHSLARCQLDMATVREDASAAGLTVSAFVIDDPGALGVRPVRPVSADPALGAQYDQAQAEWGRQQARVAAYRRAAREADRIRRVHNAAEADFVGRYDALDPRTGC